MRNRHETEINFKEVIDVVKGKIVDKFPEEKTVVSVKDVTEPKQTAEKPKVKEKAKVEPQPKTQTFPAKGAVNAYGFIHLSNGIAEAFGVFRGQKTPITIDLQEGVLIIKKA